MQRRSNWRRISPWRTCARGFVLSLSRRYDEAAKEFEEAIRLNPNVFEAYYYFARTCFAAGDIERSAELFRRRRTFARRTFRARCCLRSRCACSGGTKQATEACREGIRRAEHMLVLNPARRTSALTRLAGALFDDGQKARAMEWSQRSLELYPDDMSALISAALPAFARLGQKEQALDYLERLAARGWGKRDWIEHDPDYDILRDDPRFKRLIAKLK